jgi:hypothetical protein
MDPKRTLLDELQDAKKAVDAWPEQLKAARDRSLEVERRGANGRVSDLPASPTDPAST